MYPHSGIKARCQSSSCGISQHTPHATKMGTQKQEAMVPSQCTCRCHVKSLLDRRKSCVPVVNCTRNSTHRHVQKALMRKQFRQYTHRCITPASQRQDKFSPGNGSTLIWCSQPAPSCMLHCIPFPLATHKQCSQCATNACAEQLRVPGWAGITCSCNCKPGFVALIMQVHVAVTHMRVNELPEASLVHC